MDARIANFAWLPAVMVAACAAAAEPQSASSPALDAGLPHRSLSAIQADVHAALRSEALSRREGPNAPEVIRLIDLFREMAAHPKRNQSASLRQLGLSVKSRLEKVGEHIERQTNRAEQRAKNLPDRRLPQTHVLAQQGAPPVGGAPAPANQAAGTGTFDYGPELVEVIQQTISPATWDINGGNGSIVYFSPLRVLVVSAPGTVHGQVGNVLGQLRAAP